MHIMFSRSLKKISLKIQQCKNVKNVTACFQDWKKTKWQRKSCQSASADRDRLESIFDVIVFEDFRFSATRKPSNWTNPLLRKVQTEETSPFSKMPGYV